MLTMIFPIHLMLCYLNDDYEFPNSSDIYFIHDSYDFPNPSAFMLHFYLLIQWQFEINHLGGQYVIEQLGMHSESGQCHFIEQLGMCSESGRWRW